MLLDKGFRFPIRASIEHLDPGFYSRLEVGDQLVIYTHGIVGSMLVAAATENPRSASAKARALIESIETRELGTEIVDVGLTRIVWEIVHAADLASAAE